jgi:hypothetical protein
MSGRKPSGRRQKTSSSPSPKKAGVEMINFNFVGDTSSGYTHRIAIHVIAIHKCRSFITRQQMPGDVDTSFGNSLIKYYILISLLNELNIVGDAIVNGDDFILFTTRYF